MAMTEAAAREKIKAIIVDQLGVDSEAVTPESTFEDLGADSLDQIELTLEFDEVFDIEIPDADAEKIERVEDIVTYVIKKAA